jgi:hypothetical protein
MKLIETQVGQAAHFTVLKQMVSSKNQAEIDSYKCSWSCYPTKCEARCFRWQDLNGDGLIGGEIVRS